LSPFCAAVIKLFVLFANVVKVLWRTVLGIISISGTADFKTLPGIWLKDDKFFL
jgi:hypothetical protein